MGNSDLLPIEHPASAALAEDRLINIVFFSPRAVDSEKITRLESGLMINLLDNQLTLNMKLFKDKVENLIFQFGQDSSMLSENIQNILSDKEIRNYADNTAQTITTGFKFYSNYQIRPDLRLYSFLSYTLIN